MALKTTIRHEDLTEPCIGIVPARSGHYEAPSEHAPKPLRFASPTLGVRSEAKDGLANDP